MNPTLTDKQKEVYSALFIPRLETWAGRRATNGLNYEDVFDLANNALAMVLDTYTGDPADGRKIYGFVKKRASHDLLNFIRDEKSDREKQLDCMGHRSPFAGTDSEELLRRLNEILTPEERQAINQLQLGQTPKRAVVDSLKLKIKNVGREADGVEE